MAAQVEIISEDDIDGGWSFACHALDDAGDLHRFTLTLSWADYNLWSPNGAAEPAQVAAGVLRFVLSRQSAEETREAFNAAIVRRMFDDADGEIPKFIS